MAEPTVRISGIVLTSLMFQHLNEDSDVEGLLLGENHVEEHVTISDAREDHVHLRQTCNIHKHVCCHKLNTWYDAAGRVDAAAVRQLLGSERRERVIGWYRQRRNSPQRMSMRERAVHENLKVALRAPGAVFLLLTPAALTEAGSTHRAEYVAFLAGDRQVAVRVTNLASLDRRAYWTASPNAAAGYRRAVGRHSAKLLDAGGQLADVDGVSAMNESLQDELQGACDAVVDSERAVAASLADVCALRKKLRDSKRKSAIASKEGATVPSRNARLQLAIRALAKRSPLFASCTLTLDGSPVPDATFAQDATCAQVSLRPRAGKRKRRKGCDAAK
ncbi:BRCA1-A complex subunit Abraxas 1 isoform X2 [Festucalex cinctus]